MMGIAFIGAVVGHVGQVSAGASSGDVIEKVRKQIAKKFGAKGGVVVDSNMEIIREGIQSTRRVDYASESLARIDAKPAPIMLRNVSLSASRCQLPGAPETFGLFDRDYFNEIVAGPFREGTISESPVLPGTGLFMPAGTAGSKDKGLFRRAAPQYDPSLCTACMECTLVCPDAAIPGTVHEIHALLLEGIRALDIPEAQREALRAQVYPVAEAVREAYRRGRDARAFHERVAEAASLLPERQPVLLANFTKLVDVLSVYPVARTRPFFDAAEKAAPGAGALFSVTVDPWKCTGCLECVDVCGPGALKPRDQEASSLEAMRDRFEFMSRLPETPARFIDGALEENGDAKRLFLDRSNYYAATGGHGACRGCGEVTATRMILAASTALASRNRKAHIESLEGLIAALGEKAAGLSKEDAKRRERIENLAALLEKRLYFYESGPTGNGPSGTIVANSTGCSSVYSSTVPFNPFNTPWVNSLFQDAQPLAKGIFEGVASQVASDVRALRIARLELDDAYVPEKHDAELKTLSWPQFSLDELRLLPTVLTIGGDGASYDIGFGALSRILASMTPIKMLVLNTGAYSNTGGQASTSSYIGQDSDLARVGAAYNGKRESRKELGLLAAFHSKVFVCSTCTSLQGHFLKNALEFLTYTEGAALFDVYTPCQGEHGIADNASARQARLAVASRMNPVFVHDPRRGDNIHDWFSLEGNPDREKTWASSKLEYLDADGKPQLLTVALTPASFALSEGRFKKQFRALPASATDIIPIEEYIELDETQRQGKTPFVHSTDGMKRLIRLAASPAIVALVEERRKFWSLLQYLDGQHVSKMSAEYRAGVAALQAQVKALQEEREDVLDGLARSMAELAVSSKAPANGGYIPIVAASSAPATPPTNAQASASGLAGAFEYDDADQVKCTNCRTCYQDLPELFEKTLLAVDGGTREVAHLIPGALSRVALTPELQSRIRRVAANCDAEIIR
jgi:pyruvate-ferredoxin/flavodoxin oxidoreductase